MKKQIPSAPSRLTKRPALAVLGLAVLGLTATASRASAQVRPAVRVSAAAVRSARQPVTVARVRVGRRDLQLACPPAVASPWSPPCGGASSAPPPMLALPAGSAVC